HFGQSAIRRRGRRGAAREAPPTVASGTRHPRSSHVSGFLHRHMSRIVVPRTWVHRAVTGCHAADPRGCAEASFANTTIRLDAEYRGWHADRISRSYDTRCVTHKAVGGTIRVRSTRYVNVP